jgi:hypothetical protein
MQQALTKSDIFQVHRELLVAKNKDGQFGLKDVTLKQVQPVANDW